MSCSIIRAPLSLNPDECKAVGQSLNKYNVCWLPLLAKHAETPLSEGLLVASLDCEWIWHCHRVNPLRYILDCKELFGRLLDNRRVFSSVDGYSKKKAEKINASDAGMHHLWNCLGFREVFRVRGQVGNLEARKGGGA